MEAQWIGYDEADQLRELLEGIAADEHTGARARALAEAAAARVRPRMTSEELASLAELLTSAAESGELDPTWRDGAGYWSSQLQNWLRPGSGRHGG